MDRDTLTLALDQGTHATRAIVFDAAGRAISTATQPVALHRLGRLEVEQDAGEIRDSVQSVLDAVLTSAGIRPEHLHSAGLATQRSSVVAWERHSGKALSPVLSWQDRRNEALIDALSDHAGSVQQRTGLRLSPHYGASKLRWLLDHNSAVSNAQARGDLLFGPLVSWLLFHALDGHPAYVDHANASRSLLWNLQRRDWDSELLELFHVPADALPASLPVRADYGTLATTGIPLRAVNGDQSAALYAQGRPPADTLIVNIGTGAFVLLPVSDITRRPADVLAGIANSDAEHAEYYLEGTVNGAGAALDWARTELVLEATPEALADWLEHVTDPPLFVNTVGGLGAPWWQSGPAPHFHTPPASPAHAMVAVLESILFLLQENIKRLQAHTPTIECIQLSGGLARYNGLCRKLADLSGLDVVRPAEVEATARGIAWLAAGCPAAWTHASRSERFAPRSNPDLQMRYRLFIDVLTQTLAA